MKDINPLPDETEGAAGAKPRGETSLILSSNLDGNSRRVKSEKVFGWMSMAWRNFMQNPPLWLGSTLLVLAAIVLLQIIPLLGQFASHLFLPVLFAGLLQIARRIEAQSARLGDLLAGFSQGTSSLLAMGLIISIPLMLGAALMFGWVALFFKGMAIGGLVPLVALYGQFPALVMQAGFFALILLAFILLFMLVLLPLVAMALWFAPALALFDGLSALSAMRASFVACLKNWLPLTLHGLILFMLVSLGMMTAGLGLLLAIPLTVASLYYSYLDIFHSR